MIVDEVLPADAPATATKESLESVASGAFAPLPLIFDRYLTCAIDLWRSSELTVGDDDHGSFNARAVRIAMTNVAALFAEGAVCTYARRIGGGAAEPISPSLWEIDNPTRRLTEGGIDLSNPFSEDALATHVLLAPKRATEWLLLLLPPAPIETGQTSRSGHGCNSPSETRGDREKAVPTGVTIRYDATDVETTPSPATPLAATTQAAGASGQGLGPSIGPSRMIRIEEVRAKTGLGRSKLYELMKRDRFPKSFALDSRARGWREDEVQSWIEMLHAREK